MSFISVWNRPRIFYKVLNKLNKPYLYNFNFISFVLYNHVNRLTSSESLRAGAYLDELKTHNNVIKFYLSLNLEQKKRFYWFGQFKRLKVSFDDLDTILTRLNVVEELMTTNPRQCLQFVTNSHVDSTDLLLIDFSTECDNPQSIASTIYTEYKDCGRFYSVVIKYAKLIPKFCCYLQSLQLFRKSKTIPVPLKPMSKTRYSFSF